MNRLPPIAALRALEASSRHLSFTRAAEELFISQSAVSHQIRHIEDLWGIKLFTRQGRRLILTNEAQIIVPVIREFMEGLNRALQDIQNIDSRKSIRVSLVPSLAMKWLLPRLRRFNEIYPDIDVWVSTTDDLVDFTDGEVDLAIRLGNGVYPNLHVDLLLEEYVFPVCSNDLIDRLGKPSTPEDLLRYPLLYRYSHDACSRWRDWFRDAGINVKSLPRGSQFPDSGMAAQAAVDHQGVALARSAIVEDDLANGRLVKLFDVYSPSPLSHYLVYPEKSVELPRIAAFRSWLLDEADRSQASFDAIGGRSSEIAA